MTKVAAPTAPHGHFTKGQFRIDLEAGRVTCPARLTVPITPARQGGGVARFGRACAVCPFQDRCTSSQAGRTITIHPQERRLQAARVASVIRPGGPTTAPTGRPWSASSPTCSAAATAADEPASEDGCGSPRTGGCWPPRSTWPGCRLGVGSRPGGWAVAAA